MKEYHLTVLVVGFGLAYAILHLVRRDHLYIRQGVFWIFVAGFSLGLAIWPTLIDTLGAALGIAYPPTLLFLVAIVVLVVKSLFADLTSTRLKRDIRRLNQRLAMLEAEHPVAEDQIRGPIDGVGAQPAQQSQPSQRRAVQ